MRLKDFGYVRVAAASIPVAIADPETNGQYILDAIVQADRLGVEVLVFPELTISGYSCGELFNQRLLLDRTLSALKTLVEATADLHLLFAVGLPLSISKIGRASCRERV